MATSQKHLLNQSAPNPVLTARTAYERGILPTLLEVRTGSPGSLRAISADAQSLQGFATRAKETIKSIGSAHWRIADDATLNEAAKLVRSAAHASERIKASRSEFGRIAEKALSSINRLEGELKTALRAPSSAGEALIEAELRALLRSENDPTKQMALLTDPAIRAAAARAPAVATGLSAEVHNRVKQDQMQAIYPEQFEEFTDLREALKTAETALRAVETQAADLVDFETAAALDSRRTIAAI